MLLRDSVALRKESVDRNNRTPPLAGRAKVALRKESVDRNSFYAQNRHLAKHVALRKESVDRNCNVILLLMGNLLSLSARRAWIEISKCSQT